MSLLLLFAGAVVGPVNADLTFNEQDDTVSSTTTLDLIATLAVTEADDVASGAGTVDIVATAAITEAHDTVTAAATIEITATAAITEGGDVPSAAGTVDIVGSLALTEGDDAIAAAATIEILAVAVINEGDDTFEASAIMPVFYPRRGGVDDREEYECWLRQWEESLRRIIDRAFAIAAGEIDPITGEPIPPPDHSPVIAAMLDQALSLDRRRVEAFMAEQRRLEEDDAMAVLLLA